MTTLFNELKRRNVVRVGVAYLVATWLVLQISDTLIDLLEMPSWVGKLLFMLLALGFPLALIFSWAFELTPEGLKAEADVDRSKSITNVTAKRLDLITIGLVAVALAVFAGDRFLSSKPVAESSSDLVRVASAPDASVAVLPFANISQVAENEPFTVGIHHDLLTQISRIKSLKTISRTSVLPYRDTMKPLSQIGAELGVATILEGGVQRAGDTVRINVQLIDAQTDAQLWGERYERQLTAANIFKIQSEIVKAIADALHSTLSPDEENRIDRVPTRNLAALEQFFIGRERLESRSTLAFSQAVGHYEKAIALDPDFALAYVGLADSYQLLEDAGGLTREKMYEKSGTALAKAMLLDGDLGAAYSSLAGLNWTNGDYPEALAGFQKAIELSPNYSRAYLWYGTLLLELGRVDDAIATYKQGINYDPLSPIRTESLGTAFEYQGRFDDAMDQFRKTIMLDNSFSASHMFIGNINWMAAGSLQQAAACQRKSIELDRGARLPRTWHGLFYLDLGDVDKAEPWIKSALLIADKGQEPRAAMALLSLYRGNNADAIRFAEESLAIPPYYPDQRMFQSMMLALLRNQDLKIGKPEDARTRYEKTYPELLNDANPRIGLQNYRPAIDFAYVLQTTGDDARATLLLGNAMNFIQTGGLPRLGIGGYGIADVQIHALRGEPQKAISALRQAIDEEWRGFWSFYLRNNLNLASLQDNGEFQSLVRDVETSMIGRGAELNDMAPCGALSVHESALQQVSQ